MLVWKHSMIMCGIALAASYSLFDHPYLATPLRSVEQD